MRKKNPRCSFFFVKYNQKKATCYLILRALFFKWFLSFLRYFRIIVNIPNLSERLVLFTAYAVISFLLLLKEIHAFFSSRWLMYEGFDFLRSNAQGHILVLLVLCYVGTKALNGCLVLCFLSWFSTNVGLLLISAV